MSFGRMPAYIGGPTNRGAPGYGEDNVGLEPNSSAAPGAKSNSSPKTG